MHKPQAHLNTTPKANTPDPAGLVRRLLALLYDCFLAVSIVFLIAGIYVACSHLIIGGLPASAGPIQLVLLPGILLGLFAFYATFWRCYGRTLGMQTWHLRIISTDNTPLTWQQCGKRFMLAWVSFALLGIGYWWAIWDREQCSWHDRFSKTRIIKVNS